MKVKEEYEKIREKYKFPSYADINEEFEISSIDIEKVKEHGLWNNNVRERRHSNRDRDNNNNNRNRGRNFKHRRKN